MIRDRFLKMGVLTLVAGVLVGCGSSDDISLRNENYVLVRVENGVLNGRYNPAGYDSSLTQNQIKGACASRTLAGYGEQPSENGLVAFTAKCDGASIFEKGIVEIERTPQGTFVFEAFGR